MRTLPRHRPMQTAQTGTSSPATRFDAILGSSPRACSPYFRGRVVEQRGWMQGARAQQGLRLASAGNAADGPFARQPEGKVCQGGPLRVALLACANAHAASHALIGPPWHTFATPEIG